MTGIDVISWLDGLVVLVEIRHVFIHLSFGHSMETLEVKLEKEKLHWPIY